MLIAQERDGLPKHEYEFSVYRKHNMIMMKELTL